MSALSQKNALIYMPSFWQIFYHLHQARKAARIQDITIIRVEQIAPFPYDLIAPAINKFQNAELVWVQEEPKNMGAWTYVKPRFDTAMREWGIVRSPIRLMQCKNFMLDRASSLLQKIECIDYLTVGPWVCGWGGVCLFAFGCWQVCWQEGKCQCGHWGIQCSCCGAKGNPG